MFKTEKKHNGTCYDCGGQLEVIEVNVKKSTKVMKCKTCGLFHLYTKGLVGGWSLRKATKDPSHSLEVDW